MSKMRECCFRTVPEEGKRRLIWEITHHCTFDCEYCFQEKKRKHFPMRVLNERDLLRICSRLEQLSISDVLITGGEIYYTKDILEKVCENLKKRKLPISFSTNFIHNKEFVNQIFSFKPKAVNISFDPPSDGVKHFLKGNSEHIEYILKMGDLHGVQVKITGVINKNNYGNFNSYLSEITHLIDSHESLSSVYITNPHEIGYVKTDLRIENGALEELCNKVKELHYSQLKLVNFPTQNVPLQTCFAGASYVHMEPNGNIYPCHLFANFNQDVFLMGNILNDNIKEINAKLRSFSIQAKQAVIEYKKEYKECSECPSEKGCGGGCLAEIISTGQLIEPQLICKLIQPPKKSPSYRPPKQYTFLDDSTHEDILPEEEIKIIDYVKKNIRKREHDLAHGFDHIESVVKLARFIAKKEGANLRIVTAAAYFHDFAPRKKLIFESHTKISAQLAVQYLETLKFSEIDLQKIHHCIDTSSYGSSELGYVPLSLEAKVVGDADWLDAIGARGIARVFAFGAAHSCEVLGKVEWDINNPPKKKMSLIGPDPSPIYHFFSKLLWIKDRMNTDTGKKIAVIRHRRLVRFLEEYKNEMDEDFFFA